MRLLPIPIMFIKLIRDLNTKFRMFLVRHATDDLLWTWFAEYWKKDRCDQVSPFLDELKKRKSSDSQMYYFLAQAVMVPIDDDDYDWESIKANIEKSYEFDPVGEHARHVRSVCEKALRNNNLLEKT